MSTITAPAGLVPLLAPLPSPPAFDLLAAATLVDPATERWLGGGWTGMDVAGPAYTHDPCATGTEREKSEPADSARQINGRFVVELAAGCTAQGIGPNADYYTDRLRLWFQVREGAAIERVLATGDGHATLGPYLGDTNMEQLGSGAVQPLRAFELLEDEIGDTIGSGLLHASPAVAAAWDSLNLTENSRGVKRSLTTGNPIVVGRGYIGVVPDGEAALGADEAWAFASGPIEIYRGDIFINPDSYAQALDRAMNDVLFRAERPYLFNWIARQDPSDEDHVQAGVLVDLTP